MQAVGQPQQLATIFREEVCRRGLDEINLLGDALSASVTPSQKVRCEQSIKSLRLPWSLYGPLAHAFESVIIRSRPASGVVPLPASKLWWSPLTPRYLLQLCCPSTQGAIWQQVISEALREAVRCFRRTQSTTSCQNAADATVPNLQEIEPQLAGLLHSSIVSHDSLGKAMVCRVHVFLYNSPPARLSRPLTDRLADTAGLCSREQALQCRPSQQYPSRALPRSEESAPLGPPASLLINLFPPLFSALRTGVCQPAALLASLTFTSSLRRHSEATQHLSQPSTSTFRP